MLKFFRACLVGQVGISKIRLQNSLKIGHDSSIRLGRRPSNQPHTINRSRRLLLNSTRRLSLRELAFHIRPQLARILGTMRHKKNMLTPLKVTTTLPAAHRKISPTGQIFRLRRALKNLGNLQHMFKIRRSVKTAPLDPPLQAHPRCKPRLRGRKPTQIWPNHGSRIGCETQRCTVVTMTIRDRLPTTDQIATAHNQCKTAKRS